MIHPRIDELMAKVDSRYALVIVAAKRARQINNYHHQLGEGTFDEFAPPLIESRSKNYLTMALEETAEGKIVYEYPKRARQINNYHHQLGEGTFDEFAPPLIESRSKNYLTMALEETAEGKIVYEYPKSAKK